MSTLVQRSVLDASGFPLDQIQILGIAARGFHGVLESEREAGQDFSADVTLYLDTRAAARDDDLDETVNYALVAQDVVDILAGEPVDLIETVAEQIAAAVLDRPLVASVDVTVHKPQAPIPVPFSDVTVTINRDRLNVPVVTSPVAPALDDLPADDLAGGDLPADDGDPLSSTTRPDVALSTALPAAGALSAGALAAGGADGAPGTALLDEPLSGTVPAPVELPEAFEPVALRVDETESDVETPEPSSSPTLDLPLGRLAAPVAARESDPASYSTSELHLESDLVHDEAADGGRAVAGDDHDALEQDVLEGSERHQDVLEQDVLDKTDRHQDVLDQDVLDDEQHPAELDQTELGQTELDPTERHPVGDATGESDGLDASTPPAGPSGSGTAALAAPGAASVPPADDSLLEEQARLSEQARRPEVFGLRPRSEAHQRPTSEDEARTEGDDGTVPETTSATSAAEPAPSEADQADQADQADPAASPATEQRPTEQPAPAATEEPARSAAASAAEPATAARAGGPQPGAAFFAAASAAVANASRDRAPLSFEELLNPSGTPERSARGAAEQAATAQPGDEPRRTLAHPDPEGTDGSESTDGSEDTAAEHTAAGTTARDGSAIEGVVPARSAATDAPSSPVPHESAHGRPAGRVSDAAPQRDADAETGSETAARQTEEPVGTGAEERSVASSLEAAAEVPVWQPSAFSFEPVRGRSAEPTTTADRADLSRFAPRATDETPQGVVAQDSALETTALETTPLLDPDDVEDPFPAQDPTPIEDPLRAEDSNPVEPSDDIRLDETQLVPTHPAPVEATSSALDEPAQPAPAEPVYPAAAEPDYPSLAEPTQPAAGEPTSSAAPVTDETQLDDPSHTAPAATDTLDPAPLGTATHGSTPLDTAEWAAPGDRDEADEADEATEASDTAEASEAHGPDEATAEHETDGLDETDETDEPEQAGDLRPVVGDPEAPTSPVPVVVPDDEDETPVSTPPSGVPALAAPVAGALGLGAGARGETPLPLDRMDARPDGPVEAVLALGANLGDAQGTLRRAVAELGTLTGVDVVRVGPLARTAAVGGPEQPDFLNTVVIVQTTLSPRELLHGCQSVEAGNGRVRDVRWGPRTLDIDIVVFGDVIGSATDLELPHPRANERAFVLAPWAHLDPEAHLPGLGGGPVAALAATAHDREGIRWLALDWLHDAEVPTAAQTSRPAAVAPALTAVQVVSLPDADGDGPAAPAEPTVAPGPAEAPADAPAGQSAPAAGSAPAAEAAAPDDREVDDRKVDHRDAADRDADDRDADDRDADGPTDAGRPL